MLFEYPPDGRVSSAQQPKGLELPFSHGGGSYREERASWDMTCENPSAECMQQHVHAALASQEWEWPCYGIYLGGHDELCHMLWWQTGPSLHAWG